MRTTTPRRKLEGLEFEMRHYFCCGHKSVLNATLEPGPGLQRLQRTDRFHYIYACQAAVGNTLGCLSLPHSNSFPSATTAVGSFHHRRKALIRMTVFFFPRYKNLLFRRADSPFLRSQLSREIEYMACALS